MESLILSQSEIARRQAVAKSNSVDSDKCQVCFGHQLYKAGPDGKPVMVRCPGCGGGKSGE